MKMNKYIDADKAIKDYARYGIKHFYDATDLEAILNECPAADVQEVRHGHWEKVDDNPYEYVAVCSVCRNEVKQPTCMLKPIYSYCPICGARMVNEDA